MRSPRPTTSAAVVLALGGLAGGATGGAQAGTRAAGSGCDHRQSVCATLAPYGPSSFVLKVYAPTKAPVPAFDIWTGKKPTALRPKAVCRSHGTASGADFQLADYAVTRCAEAIKAGRVQTYCFSGGGGIPFLSGSAVNPVHIDAGAAGQQDVTVGAKTTKCPADVADRKPSKKR